MPDALIDSAHRFAGDCGDHLRLGSLSQHRGGRQCPSVPTVNSRAARASTASRIVPGSEPDPCGHDLGQIGERRLPPVVPVARVPHRPLNDERSGISA